MQPCRYFIRGEIDVANADDLLTTLRRTAGQDSGGVVVDCMDLTFIGAAGIDVLVVAHGELAQQGRDFVLVHPSPFFSRLLQLLDLTYLLGHAPLTADKQTSHSPADVDSVP